MSMSTLSLGNSNTQHALMSIAGTFYNSSSAAPTTELGDVFVRLAIGDRGNGPEAWYELQVSTNDDFSTATLTTDSFGAVTLNTEYTARILYDGNMNFAFTFNGITRNVNGPARAGNAFAASRIMTERLRFGQINSTPNEFDEGSDDGTPAVIAGTFDDVTTDGGLQDSFAATDINQTIWSGDENRVVIIGEQLHFSVKTQSASRMTESVVIKGDHRNAFGAEIELLSGSTTNANTLLIARIAHYLSNDTVDTSSGGTANGLEGNIWTQFGLESDAGVLSAFINTQRSTDATFSTSQEVFSTDIRSINFDQVYTLLIEKTGSIVEYKIDGDVVFTLDLANDFNTVLSGNDFAPTGNAESFVGARVQNQAGEVLALFDDIITPENDSSGSSDGSSGAADLWLLMFMSIFLFGTFRKKSRSS